MTVFVLLLIDWKNIEKYSISIPWQYITCSINFPKWANIKLAFVHSLIYQLYIAKSILKNIILMLHMLDDSEIFKAVKYIQTKNLFSHVWICLLCSIDQLHHLRYFAYKMHIHHKSNPKTIIAGATIFILYRDKKWLDYIVFQRIWYLDTNCGSWDITRTQIIMGGVYLVMSIDVERILYWNISKRNSLLSLFPSMIGLRVELI